MTAALDVLMLSDVYFPRVNGVSTSIRAAIQSLRSAGHRVTLVAPDYATAAQAGHDAELGHDVTVLRLPSRTIFFDPEDKLVHAGELRRAAALLAARRWDVIHVHTPFRAHQLGARLRRATEAPMVETYHTYFEAYASHYLPWLPAGLLRAFSRRVSRKLCHEADHLIVPTTEMAQVLHDYGIRTPHTVLPTGIDLSEFAHGDGAAFRARHGIAPDTPLLVTVSRLAREKNIDLLLEAARRLLAEFPDMLLLVAGEGPDAARLRGLAGALGLEGNVRFLGNLDRGGELQDCYRAADAFVFASPTETQGLVLIEAMALGVPIVSTAVMGTATVLRDARSAVIAPEDAGGFARCAGDVLRDRRLRDALSSAGPGDARAWDSGAVMHRLVDVYRSAAAARGGIRQDAGAPGGGAPLECDRQRSDTRPCS